jgi:hypothetical protein
VSDEASFAAAKLKEYRVKVAGTNIDARSLLSTDYFNTFNSVVMLFDLLPSCPEMIEEIDQWEYYDYVQHFEHSGLSFAQLAIEAYQYAPTELRERFERKINGMRIFIEEAAHTLRALHDAGETSTFCNFARAAVILFRSMMTEGSSIVHGDEATLSQDSIDKLF